MRTQGRIIISQDDLSFLGMRYDTGLKVVAHGLYRSAAKVFIHADMTPDKGVHLHVQARLNVRILAVGERSDEQVDRDQFAGVHVHVVHSRTGPVDFRSLSGLVFEMVGEAVCDGEFGIPFVELCLAHGDLAVTFAAFDVFLMEKLEGDTYAFQFLMYMLVVRITVHGLVREHDFFIVRRTWKKLIVKVIVSIFCLFVIKHFSVITFYYLNEKSGYGVGSERNRCRALSAQKCIN